MNLGFVGFLLVRVCVTLDCLSTPLCGMNDMKEIVIKSLRAPSKEKKKEKKRKREKGGGERDDFQAFLKHCVQVRGERVHFHQRFHTKCL